MSLMGRVEQLAEHIGPRKSASDAERKAALLIEQQIATLGLQPVVQAFVSAMSPHSPLAVACGAALVALFLLWQPQPAGAAAGAVLASCLVFAVALERASRDNPLRWVVPTARSANVLVRVNRSGAPARAAVLVSASVDSARASILSSTPGGRRFARALPTLLLAALAVLALLSILGIASNAPAIRQLALIPGAVIAACFVILLLAARAPATPGANDNAAGVAVAMDLAERLSREPLAQRDVVIAFVGSGQVRCAGLEALFAQQRPDVATAAHLAIVAPGGQSGQDLGPSIVAGDPALLSIARDVVGRNSDLGAGVATPAEPLCELAVSAQHRVRALALTSLDASGEPPNRWRASDVFANVSEATLRRSAELAMQLVRAFDAEDRA